jgi:vitamin B12 transporter
MASSRAIDAPAAGRGPATFEPGGFIPEGGVLRQRRNLDRIEVFGFEAGPVCKLAANARLRAQYVYTHPTVERAHEGAKVRRQMASAVA